MKSFFQKLWATMNDPRYEKPLLVLVPFLTLLLCALLLAPRLLERAQEQIVIEDEAPTLSAVSPTPVQSPTASPVASAEPTPAPSPTPTPVPLRRTSLRGHSVDRDLMITVCGEDGKAIQGSVFTLDVTFPNGETYSYRSETDGSCYLVRLEAGAYRVALRPSEGFAEASPIDCTVSASAQYTPITDIEAVVDLKDVTEIADDELPPVTQEAPEPVLIEEIETPQEDSDSLIVVGEEPLLNENGEQSYHYTVRVGPNGYLLYRETGEESRVLPIDEDGDGVPEFGMEFVDEQLDEEGNVISEAYTLSVELFDAQGQPLALYAIDAEPIMTEITRRVGWQELYGRMYYVYEDGSCAVGLKRIDGKLYYFNDEGLCARSLGVDVSYYNNSVDWQRVKAQGIDFAIIRVGGRGWTSGLLYEDSRMRDYLYGARAAGLRVGVYFYSTAVNTLEAVEEASVAISALRGASLDLPIYIDMEWSGEYPNGRADKLGASERAGIAVAFCETVRSAGYRAGVYSNQNFLKYSIDYGAISGYQIWLASYTRMHQMPAFDQRYDIWQFTDRAAIDGIEGEVDMNAVF